MNTRKCTNLIGLDPFRQRIISDCEEAGVYQVCGLKPKSKILNLSAGEGRTTMLKYMRDLFKKNSVLRFSSGLDEYLEFKFDGTYSQMMEVFSCIKSAAIFENTYSDLIALDISGMTQSLNEIHSRTFIEKCGQLSKEACVIFFVNSEISNNEQRIIDLLKRETDKLEFIQLSGYSEKELVEIALLMLNERNVEVLCDRSFLSETLENCLKSRAICKIKDLTKFVESLIRRSDWSQERPRIRIENVLSVVND